MGLSARTDDNTGLPLGEGYIIRATSALNGLVFRDPASARAYVIANATQMNVGNGNSDGDYNTESASGQTITES